MAILLILTPFIFLSYYLLFLKLKIDSLHQKIILAGLGGFGQLILTQLMIGVAGLLYLPVLIVFNIIVVIVMLFLCSRMFLKNPYDTLRQDYQRNINGLYNSIDLENILLLLLFAFIFIWAAIVIYFFPAREPDSLTYHLPPIYEYIINHKIFLLPVEINKRFAFPENAELLFLWPAIFLHSQQFVNSVQFIVELWGVVILYGLGRSLGIYPKISLFVSLLFLFTPLVLSQMGSCHIDIIIAVFYLAVLYSVVMFYKTNRLLYFYSTALAAGLLWGMRYNEFIFILMAVPLLWMGDKVSRKHWFGLIIIFFIAGGFWYLRNFLVLRVPIYPWPFSRDGVHVYLTDPAYGTLFGFLMLIPSKVLCLWKDIGLGTAGGGYGLIFWGLALPAWFYVWFQSIKQKNKFDFWLYSPLIIGIGQIMFIPVNDSWLERYSLFVVTLGLLALGQVIMIFEQILFFKRVVKILCVVFAGIAVVHLSNNNPSYRIDKPVKDFVNGTYWTQQNLDPTHPLVWGVLDYLTLNDPKGLSCHIATMSSEEPYPLNAFGYGAKLQNRIWDLQQDKSHMPDAFVYLSDENRGLWFNSHGPQITLKEMMVNPDYSLIVGSPHSFLFIRKEFFRNPLKQQLLVNYFKNIGKAALLSVQ